MRAEMSSIFSVFTRSELIGSELIRHECKANDLHDQQDVSRVWLLVPVSVL